MLIKTINEINNVSENIVVANKIRCTKIQNNIKDLDFVDIIFNKLEAAVISGDEIEISSIIRNTLFYEEVVDGLGKLLISKYQLQNDKSYFINKLKKSYVIRGVKGIQFAWMPILIKG